jgi:aldehyde:ferredoxin oxidoreductase
MFRGGYLGKVLHVNLATRQSRVVDLDESERLSFLGGRGLGALWYARLGGSSADPLSGGNPLSFVTGPLTGVPLPSTTKFSLTTRSPETGLYLCSNSGGNFGPWLKRAGYDALILEGASPRPVYLRIVDEQATLHDARPFLGLPTRHVRRGLLQDSGDEKAAVLCCGPAAERGVRFSSILVDDGRAFGRGGAGAVLAAKNVKGIVVSGHGSIPVADPARVRAIQREAIRELRQTRAVHTQYGTAQYVQVINELGCYPARNFQSSHLAGAEGTYAQAMRDRYWTRNTACFGCPVACGKLCEVKEGPFRGARARPEFETIGLFGGSCALTDFAAILASNELCDEYGIDTISAGNAVALAMELFERGEIHMQDTGGAPLRFGDGQASLQVIRLIGERRLVGDLLAKGMRAVQAARPDWSRYILAVKGLPAPAYDPRGFYGMGLAYGTSSRGACHNVGGWTIRDELQSNRYDRYALHGKAELVKRLQDTRAYLDSLGLCTVVRGSLGFTDHPTGDVLEAVTGHDFTPELTKIGERIYALERSVLNREGVRRADDYLPERFMTETVPDGPAQGRVLAKDMYDVMLDEYYALRGWDADGVVGPERPHPLCPEEMHSQGGEVRPS